MEGVVALCKICPNNLKIKGSLRVSSNFIQHLKQKHPQHFNEFAEKKTEFAQKTRDTKNIFDEKLVKFLANTYSPLRIVENPTFIDLFKETSVELKSRKVITAMLNQKHDEYTLSLKKNFVNCFILLYNS